MNAFCNNWKEFEPVEVVEIGGLRFRSLKYWSFAGFIVFLAAVLLFPFFTSPWIVPSGAAGGAIWVGFGAAYRRAKFPRLKS